MIIGLNKKFITVKACSHDLLYEMWYEINVYDSGYWRSRKKLLKEYCKVTMVIIENKVIVFNIITKQAVCC